VISGACRRAKIATGMSAAHRRHAPREAEDALVAAAASEGDRASQAHLGTFSARLLLGR